MKLPSAKQLRTQVVASSCGIVLTSVFLNPLGVIKIRLQSAAEQKDTVLNVARNVYRTEGLRAFWRGINANLIASVPTSAVYMVCYEASRDVLTTEEISGDLAPYGAMTAGFLSRLITATMSAPLEVVRTRQSGGSSNNVLQELRKIVEAKGSRGLFTGLGASIARDAPFSAIYWGWLEWTKGHMINKQWPPPFTIDPKDASGERRLASGGMLVCAGSAGMVAAATTHPFDVIKTRAQMASLSPKQVC
ncbi:hypothetical protein CYMTET_46684 [Cymbomonas tetramitiformis]|uniref:Mitochondrial carrier protein n=1 Tax=Cymbomonas tetramitiformis TaxID=36881 RepID=A0AAE0BXP1_9CHLO|nr:hypothetical protein CYMTET_46684 [Cymbomonas tetramitiformis]